MTPDQEGTGAVRPVRLQLSRRAGFSLQAHSRAVNGLPAVKVDRTTDWGNPYRPGMILAHGPHAGAVVRDVRHAVDLFDEWARAAIAGEALPQNDGGPAPPREQIARSLVELRGKNLACWCGSGPCHADVLLRLANGPVCDTPTPSTNAPSGDQPHGGGL